MQGDLGSVACVFFLRSLCWERKLELTGFDFQAAGQKPFWMERKDEHAGRRLSKGDRYQQESPIAPSSAKETKESTWQVQHDSDAVFSALSFSNDRKN